MATENNDQRPSGWAVFGKILAIFIISISTLIQLILIKELVAWSGGGPSESHAYASMGLLIIYVLSLWLVIPATLLSIFFAVRAALRIRLDPSALVPLIVYSIITALPVLVFFLPFLPDKPRSTPAPPPQISTPAGDKTAGYEWASVKGITDKSECDNKGTPNFIIGCKKYIERQKSPSPVEKHIIGRERAAMDGDTANVEKQQPAPIKEQTITDKKQQPTIKLINP